MTDGIVTRLLSGAALNCVMRPNDEIPTNRPLHDECFQLPHIIIDGEKLSAITPRDLVTKPGEDWPIVFYYTNYHEMFGTFAPVSVAPLYRQGKNTLRTFLAPRKRYSNFSWLLNETVKVWDSQECRDMEAIRSSVRRAARLKAVFLDEEDIWNIHPVILPQVACAEDSFLLQTEYTVYPLFFRRVSEIETRIETDKEFESYFSEERRCFELGFAGQLHPFHASYQLCHDGTYKSFYDLARGNTSNSYKRLMVFSEEKR